MARGKETRRKALASKKGEKRENAEREKGRSEGEASGETAEGRQVEAGEKKRRKRARHVNRDGKLLCSRDMGR